MVVIGQLVQMHITAWCRSADSVTSLWYACFLLSLGWWQLVSRQNMWKRWLLRQGLHPSQGTYVCGACVCVHSLSKHVTWSAVLVMHVEPSGCAWLCWQTSLSRHIQKVLHARPLTATYVTCLLRHYSHALSHMHNQRLLHAHVHIYYVWVCCVTNGSLQGVTGGPEWYNLSSHGGNPRGRVELSMEVSPKLVSAATCTDTRQHKAVPC